MCSTTYIKNEDIAEADSDHGFGDRVLQTLEQQRKTKSWLAERIGVSRQAINYMLHHSSNPKYVSEIAELLEVSPEWLLFARGSRQVFSEENAGIIRIPVLTMNQVMTYLKNKDNHEEYEYTHISINPSVSSSCFAIKLENASMEPLFNQGALLIFNYEIAPKNKDYIIFYSIHDKEIYFRQYLVEGKDIYMKAFDAMFGVFKNADITIFGVLIESRNIFK